MRSGSCPQRHTPPPELSLSVRRAIFTSLPVVAAPVYSAFGDRIEDAVQEEVL